MTITRKLGYYPETKTHDGLYLDKGNQITRSECSLEAAKLFEMKYDEGCSVLGLQTSKW